MSRAQRPQRSGAAAIARTAMASLSLCLLSACSSTPDEQPPAPPPPTYSSANYDTAASTDAPSMAGDQQQQELTQALRHLWRDHFFAAEESLRKLVETADVERSIRSQARAALVLLYLDSDNPRYSIERATNELDNLYLNARSEISESLLFSALQRAVENALRLSDEINQRVFAEKRSRNMEQEVIALQIALEKLRKLLLQ